jgi:hypothetical protein
MEVSLYKILRNEKYDYEKHENVEEFDNATREKLFSEIRAWVAGTARGKRRERIFRCPIGGVDLCGILQRLIIDTETLKVEYIAGQDYPSEMYTIRDCFD